jgi:hypothetical protein
MLFSSSGREGIGLKDTLARAGRRWKSKKFIEAIRGLILQEADSRNADRQEKPLPHSSTETPYEIVVKIISMPAEDFAQKLIFYWVTQCSLSEMHKKSLKLLKQ